MPADTSRSVAPPVPSLPATRPYQEDNSSYILPSSPSAKTCFVTTGLTAPFPLLIKAVLSQPFLRALSAANYRHLDIQYGNEIGQKCFDDHLWVLDGRDGVRKEYGVDVTGFGFEKKGLKDQLVRARESEGCVVSHAGKSEDGFIPRIQDTVRIQFAAHSDRRRH